MELMEPDTCLVSPRTVTLQNPGAWNNKTGIHEFLAATQTESLMNLTTVRSRSLLFFASTDQTHSMCSFPQPPTIRV